MVACRVFIAVSLDGYIARLDGGIDWLLSQPVEGEDHGYDRFMADIDAIAMGRGSFDKARTFSPWPYQRPVVVLSRSLFDEDIDSERTPNVSVSALSPTALVDEWGHRGWKNVYVDGGKVIQSFLREGLISSIVITHIPILLGAGLPLFGPLDRDIALHHVRTETFGSGLVQSEYRIL